MAIIQLNFLSKNQVGLIHQLLTSRHWSENKSKQILEGRVASWKRETPLGTSSFPWFPLWKQVCLGQERWQKLQLKAHNLLGLNNQDTGKYHTHWEVRTEYYKGDSHRDRAPSSVYINSVQMSAWSMNNVCTGQTPTAHRIKTCTEIRASNQERVTIWFQVN